MIQGMFIDNGRSFFCLLSYICARGVNSNEVIFFCHFNLSNIACFI